MVVIFNVVVFLAVVVAILEQLLLFTLAELSTHEFQFYLDLCVLQLGLSWAEDYVMNQLGHSNQPSSNFVLGPLPNNSYNNSNYRYTAQIHTKHEILNTILHLHN